MCECCNLQDEYKIYRGKISNIPHSSKKFIKNECIKQIKQNSYIIEDLNTLKIIEEKEVYNFDLNQYKNNYDDIY